VDQDQKRTRDLSWYHYESLDINNTLGTEKKAIVSGKTPDFEKRCARQLILGFKDLNLMKWKRIVAPQAKKSESTFNIARKHRFGVL